MSKRLNDMVSNMENSLRVDSKESSLFSDPDDGVRGLKGSTSVNFSALGRKMQLAETEHVRNGGIRRSNSTENLASWHTTEPSLDTDEAADLQPNLQKLDISFSSPLSPEYLYAGNTSPIGGKNQAKVKDLLAKEIDKVDILFQSVEEGNLIVMAGTSKKLLEILFDFSYKEQSYILRFLLTYPYHTTGTAILENAKELWAAGENPGRRKRIIAVLKEWIQHLFYDFEKDKKLMGDLISFIGKTLPSTGHLEDAKTLQKEIQSVTTKAMTVPPQITGVPKTKGGEKSSFLDFSPGELARQLTLVDFQKYQDIPIREFLKQSWNSKDPIKAPAIIAKIDHFNEISYWAATEVVFTPNLKQRVSVVKRLIHIAEVDLNSVTPHPQKCVDCNNFNTAMAIIAGLHLSSISRLKRTWMHVPSKFVESFEQITKLLSTEGNYRNYRTAVTNATPPTNPYFGIFLRDLTFMEDGNAHKVDHLVNFDTLRMISGGLSQIRKYQELSYSFPKVPVVQEYLGKAMKLNDKMLQKYSLMCEPSYGDTVRKKFVK